MRVGLMVPPALDPVHITDLAVRAEAAGFDYICCGEHVFFHGPVQNAFVSLAAAAGATESISLLSALTILPMYAAALVAKLAVTLDRVSHGRFEMGVGVGGEYLPEFEAMGVPVSERGRRTDEILDLLHRLFAGENVQFRGRYNSIPGLTLEPGPVQPGGPAIWIGGRKQASVRRTARYGDVWLPYLLEPAKLADGVAAVREQAAAFGRDPAAIECGYFGWTAVHTRTDTAREMAISAVSATYNQDFSPLADRYLVAGNPEQVIERIRRYDDAGASTFVFAPACDVADVDATITLFADEVLPSVKTDSEFSATTGSEIQP
ncbi:LLM class flavin-dependent oxidoreductase [Nocardia jiangxiensis]|uniref:LLM class flavin-dependent oxidoreductase n=1 Tax=Nocardia jiangxiensis TaxID=282685 RepID=A0ABW6SBS7_9NOCA